MGEGVATDNISVAAPFFNSLYKEGKDEKKTADNIYGLHTSS